MDIEKKYSAYNNMQEQGPWHLIVTNRIWWDENLDKIKIWFERNYPEFIPDKDTVYFTIPTTEQYTMWRISWI